MESADENVVVLDSMNDSSEIFEGLVDGEILEVID